MYDIICLAISKKKVIHFYYENELRIVEPHCHGITTAGNIGLRAFQVGGYSSSGSLGWKMYDLNKASAIEITNKVFISARSGYKKGDRGMTQIFCEL